MSDISNIIFSESFQNIFNNVCKAYDNFFKIYCIKEDIDSLQDFDDDLDYDSIIQYDDYRDDLPYVKGEVLLSPKSFYDKLNHLKENTNTYDISLADKPAVSGVETVLSIAKKLNITDISEHFDMIYICVKK